MILSVDIETMFSTVGVAIATISGIAAGVLFLLFASLQVSKASEWLKCLLFSIKSESSLDDEVVIIADPYTTHPDEHDDNGLSNGSQKYTMNINLLSTSSLSSSQTHQNEWKSNIYSMVLNAERLQWQNNIYKYVLSANKEDVVFPNSKEVNLPKRERRTVKFNIQIEENRPERGSSANRAAHGLMHAAMEKSKSDREFKRKSTRNMARELAQLLVEDHGNDQSYERSNISTDSSHNLMHFALEKAKLDRDFRRASTRSVTRNVAQAIMLKADGDSASRKGNHEDAIEKYTKAIEIDPGNSSYFVSRSAAYLKTDDNLRALEDANIAIELDLNLIKAHCVKGEALVGLGQYNDAMAAYQEGLDNCPDSFALQVGFDNAKRCRDADRDVKMQKAMDKAESDRDFKRKSTRQMARDLALALIDEDDDYYAQSSSKGPTNSLMQTAMEKAGSDRDFRRDSTRSAARNAAQALLQ